MVEATADSHINQSSWIRDVIIRTVNRPDLRSLEWDGEYLHFRKLFAEAYQMALRGEALLWIAVLPGVGLIGQVFLQLRSSRTELANGLTKAYLYGFRIRPQYRKQGLGTKVMKFVEDDLRRRGFQQLCLNVSRENSAARRLYERMGYRVIASDPGRWSYIDHAGRTQHVNEPAWRMEKYL